MANTHRMGRKLDARWLGPYKVEQITEKELHRLKCTRCGKVPRQSFLLFQLMPYICRSVAKVIAGKHIYLAFKHALQLAYYLVLYSLKVEKAENEVPAFKRNMVGGY